MDNKKDTAGAILIATLILVFTGFITVMGYCCYCQLNGLTM